MKDVASRDLIDEVIEHAPTQNTIIDRRSRKPMQSECLRLLPSLQQQFRRGIEPGYAIPSSRQLDRIATCPTARIKQPGAWLHAAPREKLNNLIIPRAPWFREDPIISPGKRCLQWSFLHKTFPFETES